MDIFETMCAILKDVDVIKKDKYNQIQKFSFRGIDDVYNMLHPLFKKYGLISLPTKIYDFSTVEKSTSRGGSLFFRLFTVQFTFYAKDGSFITSEVRAEGMDAGDKATNKAMAVAHKYALIQAFSIPTEESANEDPDQYSDFPFPEETEFDAPLKKQPTNLDSLKQDLLLQLQETGWKKAKVDYFRTKIVKTNDMETLTILQNTIKGGN